VACSASQRGRRLDDRDRGDALGERGQQGEAVAGPDVEQRRGGVLVVHRAQGGAGPLVQAQVAAAADEGQERVGRDVHVALAVAPDAIEVARGLAEYPAGRRSLGGQPGMLRRVIEVLGREGVHRRGERRQAGLRGGHGEALPGRAWKETRLLAFDIGWLAA
jgi:hypothetical protein